MEIKKSPKADLENKRGLFLEIGLVVALVLVIGAFAVTPKEHRIEKVDLGYAPVEVEIVEVTREDQKPPEAPKKVDMAVVSDMLEVVTNDTKIETEIDFAEFDVNQAIEVAPVQTEEVFEEEIFIVVEEKASFMGGDEGTFRNWVQQRVKYPAIAQENGIQGKVTISFVVNTDGSVSNIEVLRTPDRTLSDEAVRIIKSSRNGPPPSSVTSRFVRSSSFRSISVFRIKVCLKHLIRVSCVKPGYPYFHRAGRCVFPKAHSRAEIVWQIGTE